MLSIGKVVIMPQSHPQIRVLHIWDYRVNSGTNIDDHLSKLDLNQLSVSRVLTQSGKENSLPQSALHSIETMGEVRGLKHFEVHFRRTLRMKLSLSCAYSIRSELS
jgi:hypothetical protein